MPCITKYIHDNRACNDIGLESFIEFTVAHCLMMIEFRNMVQLQYLQRSRPDQNQTPGQNLARNHHPRAYMRASCVLACRFVPIGLDFHHQSLTAGVVEALVWSEEKRSAHVVQR
jgi:hypothetical protein